MVFKTESGVMFTTWNVKFSEIWDKKLHEPTQIYTLQFIFLLVLILGNISLSAFHDH